MNTRIKTIVNVVGVLAVVFASLSMTGMSVAQEDIKPTCESTSHLRGNREYSSVPECKSDWIEKVESLYIFPTERQLGLARLYWTDHYGRGNGIRRTFDQTTVNLSDKNDWIGWTSFSEQFQWYVIGAEISWGPGAAEDLCGFQVRRTNNGNDYFTIMFNQYNQLTFWELENGNLGTNEWRDVSGAATGWGAMNTLVVYVMHSSFFVFINGQYVARFQDSTNEDAPGYAALAMYTFDKSGTTYCTFEKAWVWTLDGWELE